MRIWFYQNGRPFNDCYKQDVTASSINKRGSLFHYKPALVEITGLLCIVLYMFLYNFNFGPDWLIQIQANNVYKQVTGFILLGYIAGQWRLSVSSKLPGHIKKQRRKQHKLLGSLAPVIFYLHSAETGFAYQVVLAWTFLANVFVGSINPEVLGIKIRGYYTSWLIVHISLSIVIISLALYHIYVTYAY